MRTDIDLKFADGEYRFKLGLLQIAELQTKTKVGIGALYARVLKGRMGNNLDVAHPGYAEYHLDDLRETIRLGLVGGAQGIVDGADVVVSPLRARELVDVYVDPMPLREQWDLAAAILFALIEGYEPETADDDDKKKATEPTTGDGSTTPAL